MMQQQESDLLNDTDDNRELMKKDSFMTRMDSNLFKEESFRASDANSRRETNLLGKSEFLLDPVLEDDDGDVDVQGKEDYDRTYPEI